MTVVPNPVAHPGNHLYIVTITMCVLTDSTVLDGGGMDGRSMAVGLGWVVATALFAPPGGAQAHGAVEVDLRVEAGRLVVPVETGDGSVLDFVVGNGSGVTVLTESTARGLGPDPALTLGGIPVAMDGMATVPDERLPGEGRPLAGIIGANTLNAFDMLADVPGGRLVLKPIGRAVEWPGMTLSEPLRMQVYHGVALSFQVELNGTPYRATLDLGTPFSVVNEGVRSEQSLEEEDTVTLEVAGARLEDHPVRTLDLEALRRWSPDGAGFVMVGAPLAWDCAVSISWVHQEIRTCVR